MAIRNGAAEYAEIVYTTVDRQCERCRQPVTAGDRMWHILRPTTVTPFLPGLLCADCGQRELDDGALIEAFMFDITNTAGEWQRSVYAPTAERAVEIHAELYPHSPKLGLDRVRISPKWPVSL